ncbi:hypothetical protein Dda_4224 [Drechslerella dactyloides]|uniref:Ankyrin n=1 Tax=Drechslerella dactyloides TaxID=74499 RepID=A0AAD6IZC8_DREDA|nr:hypothetical protein Dda_4224 [Drechslerella dactyloides]
MVTSLPAGAAASDGPSSSKPMLRPIPPTLDEDTIDDLLYFARTGELDDLKATINELAKSLNRYAIEIAAAAVDPYSGNTCLHMAAANNHGDVISCILALEQPPLATPVVHPELGSQVTLAPAAAPPSTAAIATSTSASTSSPTTTTTTTTTTIAAGEGGAGASPYLRTLVNWPNGSGNTPLHWACLNGHIEAVKALIAAGADPGVLNAAGHDCVYEAEVNDKSNVVEWVLNYAESLESGVGVVGEEKEDEEGNEVKENEGQDSSGDNAKVLRDEGRRHEEQQQKKEEEEESNRPATERLGQLGLEDLSDRPPTIR